VLVPFFFDNGMVRKTFVVRLSTIQFILVGIMTVAPLAALGLIAASLPSEGIPTDPEQIRRFYRVFFWTFLVAMTVFIPMLAIMNRSMIIRPLLRISERTRAFSGGIQVPVRESFTVREVDDLASSVNDMMEAVISREDALTRLNESLEEKVRERTRAHEQTIETLRSAREQLMLSEKMAVLGSLVSGVAHEINTPMSIGVTAASFLNERTRSMLGVWDRQALTQEDFERYLKDADEASRIIQSNLDHATRIINSLKQVAVDQQADERREFELGSYLDDILLSLKHQVKPGRHVLEAHTDGIILMDSYPGAVTQILNNLVFNSVVHGFGDREGGRIRIQCHAEGDEVVLVYTDDGRGLNDEEQLRIFDQFFTTRRDQGGTGLGMNIVRDLVITKLQGRIDITNPDGGGAGFTIRFPRKPNDRTGEERETQG